MGFQEYTSIVKTIDFFEENKGFNEIDSDRIKYADYNNIEAVWLKLKAQKALKGSINIYIERGL